MYIQPRQYTVKLLAIVKHASDDTYTFVLQKPRGFEYHAGQYMRLVFTHKNGDRDSRYFTFSSAPYEKTLQITVKIHPSKFREALYKVAVGEDVTFYGPIGNFYINYMEKGKYIMLAGGVGMTPFFSMLKQISHDRALVDAFYLASYQTSEDVLFMNDLRKIGERSKGHIKIWHTLTRLFPEQERKHIVDFKDMLLQEARAMGDPIWLVSGSVDFIDSVAKMLIEWGLPKDKVFTETFI